MGHIPIKILLNQVDILSYPQQHPPQKRAKSAHCHVQSPLLERVLTQWQRLLAFRKAMNLLHLAMCAVLYRRIVMASKTASKVGAFSSLFCLLLPWRSPGQYTAISCTMAGSSYFWCSPGHATLGDAICIAPLQWQSTWPATEVHSIVIVNLVIIHIVAKSDFMINKKQWQAILLFVNILFTNLYVIIAARRQQRTPYWLPLSPASEPNFNKTIGQDGQFSWKIPHT
jgi:hypothetical protein